MMVDERPAWAYGVSCGAVVYFLMMRIPSDACTGSPRARSAYGVWQMPCAPSATPSVSCVIIAGAPYATVRMQPRGWDARSRESPVSEPVGWQDARATAAPAEPRDRCAKSAPTLHDAAMPHCGMPAARTRPPAARPRFAHRDGAPWMGPWGAMSPQHPCPHRPAELVAIHRCSNGEGPNLQQSSQRHRQPHRQAGAALTTTALPH